MATPPTDDPFERDLFASIALSPIATVITNPRLPDNPIVAANAAFHALTGYDATDVIGRNCRFLSRDAQSPGRTALRNAIAEARPALVEVRNCKQDGTPFRNAVMVAPVKLADGTVGYFIGSQMDVGLTASVPAHAVHEATRKVQQLTPRQRDVLVGMLAGKLNKQIGADLGINEKTVKMHRAALLDRLGVRVSTDAIRIGLEAGLSAA